MSKQNEDLQVLSLRIEDGMRFNTINCIELSILNYERKYYWMVEKADTNFGNINEWTEITEGLYKALLKDYGWKNFKKLLSHE